MGGPRWANVRTLEMQQPPGFARVGKCFPQFVIRHRTDALGRKRGWLRQTKLAQNGL
jgi:hypothetical protein